MKDKSFKIIENSLEDIKALDTKVLNLQKLNTFTDTLLITSGSSSTHMSAISDRVIDDLKKNQIPIQSVQGKNSSDCILLDLGNIVINIMSVSARQYYDLEVYGRFFGDKKISFEQGIFRRILIFLIPFLILLT